MERAKDRMRDLLDSGEISRPDPNEFVGILAEEISNTKELAKEDQENIMRQLEFQTFQFMEELMGGEGSEGEEGFDDQIIGSEGQGLEGVRIQEIRQVFERIRTVFNEKAAATTTEGGGSKEEEEAKGGA